MTYAIIGSGRVARHFKYYLRALHQPLLFWSRNLDPEFNTFSDADDATRLRLTIEKANVVLLLLKDDGIEPFVEKYSFLRGKTLVHFSGSLVADGIQGCHPLMSFGPKLYDLGVYQEIAFVCDPGPRKFKELFPALENRSFTLETEKKAYYHSLCVTSGNFTNILWREACSAFERLNLPPEILFPYLRQTMKNIEHDYANSLTGPLSRKDMKTIGDNLKALENTPLQKIYKSFLDLEGINYERNRF